jgi:hypothetical protein
VWYGNVDEVGLERHSPMQISLILLPADNAAEQEPAMTSLPASSSVLSTSPSPCLVQNAECSLDSAVSPNLSFANPRLSAFPGYDLL